MLEALVGDMPTRPDTVEMEFGAKISGDCNLWIVSGEGEADFKVSCRVGDSEKSLAETVAHFVGTPRVRAGPTPVVATRR